MAVNVVALVVCLVALVVKIPRAVKGYGRPSTWGVAMLSGAMLLTIPDLYLVVDHALGGLNLTNVIVRALGFGAAAAMAVTLARVFGAARVEQFVLSWRGATALAASIVAEVVLLLLAHPQRSGTGVPNLGRDDRFFAWYSAIGMLYPALLAAILLLPTIRYVVRAKGDLVSRIAFSLMAGGLLGLIVVAASYLMYAIGAVGILPAFHWIPWASVILFASGLLLHTVEGWVRRLAVRPQAVTSL